MSDTDRDLTPDSPPAGDDHPDSPPGLFPPGKDDDRPDIEQAVAARSDAVARGEGGSTFDGIGGEGGAGGEVKNQNEAQQ